MDSVERVRDGDVEERLARRLLDAGRIDAASLERARRAMKASGEPLHHVVGKLGLTSERVVAEALAEVLGLPLVRAADFPDVPLFEDRLPAAFLRGARAIPVAEEAGGVVLAMADPLDGFARHAAELALRRPVTVRVALPEDIEAAFQRLYAGGRSSLTDIVGEVGGAEADEDVERLRDMANEAPVIRLVNLIIGRACASGASDIHLEPAENRLRVRYRVDGVLREVEEPPPHLTTAVVSRVKLMARMNIAEHRLPQDGRIRHVVRGKNYDFRVSTVPTLWGESVVMRVLDSEGGARDLAQLGYGGRELATLRRALADPHGILLVTGPTGSGKTTTLYAALSLLATPERKILTVEDPVEYQLPGINQMQVKPEIGLTFATLLRSILRQDPDAIMVGEIRDLETAEIAVQAALTGHLVLSTLHTNDCASTVTRLLDMGVKDYLVTSTVNLVVAQRLVRRLCPACRAAYRPLPELAERHGLPADAVLFRPAGCPACAGSGYAGRVAIAEVMPLDEPIRRLVLRQADAAIIAAAAREAGMRGMFEDGVAKALAGLTAIDEVMRVAGGG